VEYTRFPSAALVVIVLQTLPSADLCTQPFAPPFSPPMIQAAKPPPSSYKTLELP
jgi:hypothetical protein